MFEPDFTAPWTSTEKIQAFNEQLVQAPYTSCMDNIANTLKSPDACRCILNFAEHSFSMAKDPRCDPSLPVAHLWPVYVGNYGRQAKGHRHLRFFFKTKGLTVYWMVQKPKKIGKKLTYDMLVYFSSESDAQKALQYNGGMKDGARISVLPGREPVFFRKKCSFRYIAKPMFNKKMESSFQQRQGQFKSVQDSLKRTKKGGVVEFASKKEMNQFLEKNNCWIKKHLKQDVRKQRYLECDVADEILRYLDSKPDAFKYMRIEETLQIAAIEEDSNNSKDDD